MTLSTEPSLNAQLRSLQKKNSSIGQGPEFECQSMDICPGHPQGLVYEAVALKSAHSFKYLAGQFNGKMTAATVARVALVRVALIANQDVLRMKSVCEYRLKLLGRHVGAWGNEEQSRVSKVCQNARHGFEAKVFYGVLLEQATRRENQRHVHGLEALNHGGVNG